MLILMVGGGSGGHVTPLKAVAKHLFILEDEVTIEVLTDTRFYPQAQEIFADMPEVRVKKVTAGKLRRYNSKSFAWHVTHVPTLLHNFIDVFKIAIGVFQSLLRFLRRRPALVFSKGGFVSVPVCIAAHLFRVPIIIHDSDAHPGLSSRIVSRWAARIATGMPTKFYRYPTSKTVYTGIPVNALYKPTNEASQAEQKKVLGFDSAPLLLMTGGGNGAERLNAALELVAEPLINDGWQIVQITGSGKDQAARASRQLLSAEKRGRWRIEEFVDLVPYVLAADVVVTRTGATTMQELANAKKACVTVPSRFLSGGHQLKNAEIFRTKKAAVVLDEQLVEDDVAVLLAAVHKAYDEKQQLGSTLYATFAKPEAAKTIASLVLSQL